MKVLVISHMFPKDEKDIYGIFVYKQVQALQQLGCDVTVVAPIPYAPFPLNKVKDKWKTYSMVPKENKYNNISVFYPRYIEFPKGLFLPYSGNFMYLGIHSVVDKLLKENKFDVIHSHVVVPDGYAAMLLLKNKNIPHIVTVHGQDLQFTINKSNLCKEKLFKVFANADRTITVSNKLKNVIKNETFGNKIRVVNNGVNFDEIVPSEKPVTKENNLCTVLSVSSLIKSKGIDLNIIAISKLIKKYANIMYYIIGQGEERQNLENLAKSLGIEKNIKFLGQLPHEEAMKYMSKAYIFSLPSWEEGFGVVYIEAMASGRPVIGVSGEGIEDVIVDGENGFLVKPHDADEIAEKIHRLLSDEGLAESMGEKARKDVIENFTWQKNAENTIEVYKELIN